MKTLDVFEGDLYRGSQVLRKDYKKHFSQINTLAQFKATLREGPRTWPGFYPLYFITHDGAALCFDCGRKEFRQIAWDFMHKTSTGWRVVACDINYEDNDLHCDHCDKQIESAYGN